MYFASVEYFLVDYIANTKSRITCSKLFAKLTQKTQNLIVYKQLLSLQY